MTGQNNAAAERSAHERDPDAGECFVCGGPWKKGGASYAVRVLPPMVQVCSATCAADPKFAPRGALRPNGAVECPPVSDTDTEEASKIK
jgi:hypothetical protein